MREYNDDGVKMLMVAIVEQAVRDYEIALSKSINGETEEERSIALDRAKELEDWFKSEWASALTGDRGDIIVDRIKKRYLKCDE